MSQHPVYKYKDFMKEEFPFKMEIRSLKNNNRTIHAHEHLQICYMRKGSCMHSINRHEAVLVKGDIFSVPPFQEHQIIPLDNTEFELVQIDFMPFFINENMRELATMESFIDFLYIQPFVTANGKLLPKLNLSSESNLLIEHLISSMQQELSSKEDGYQLSIKADLLKLLIVAGREFTNFSLHRKESQAIMAYKQSFNDVMIYIEKNFAKELSLEDIAAKANMSPSYFSHIFKLIKGNTLTEFVNSTRIHKAMELLKDGSFNITEICYSVGFNNLGHFNKIFKKITGVTPSQYKKSHRDA